MTEALCKLAIVCPTEVAEDIVDTLLELEPSLPGFTTFAADGHGQDFSHASAQEHVRGRIGRRVLWAVLAESDVKRALEAVKARSKGAHVIYWTEPVLEYGSL
ncbi:DUF3240 family protein [Kordiimonas marina]|uniref:DUF3240 family protein n=1 Tax=Kordiimonas marina TaxID=2872312 RepID=UPI001FF54FFF|nr:DUF3240 family protein [Kordiimonas marina]MCJ9428849.1 DUF3240 family protein [Kordiimonas marina]